LSLPSGGRDEWFVLSIRIGKIGVAVPAIYKPPKKV
jgi:hypothetical protein